MVQKSNLVDKFLLFLERGLLTSLGTHFLSFQEIDKMIDCLTEKVLEFKPQCIVGILSCGEYIGRKMARDLNVDYREIGASRRELNFLGVPLNDRLFLNKVPIISDKYAIEISGEFKDKGYKRIILADEDCLTGRAFRIVKQKVREKSPNAIIRTAALMIGDSKNQFIPDYFFGKFTRLNKFVQKDTRYPWARQSPHYSQYEEQLIKLRQGSNP